MNKILSDAISILEARKDRSQWNRAVTDDAYDLIVSLDESIEHTTQDMINGTKCSYISELLNNRKAIENAMLNGARDWSQYSWGGCALAYDGDIAEHYCTPSELKRTRNGERRPNSSEEWLDMQARALAQAARRAQAAIKSAILKEVK